MQSPRRSARPSRLEALRDDALSLRDVLYGEGVAAVEWFERLSPAAGDDVLLITLRHAGPERRLIRLEARGPRHERLVATALGI